MYIVIYYYIIIIYFNICPIVEEVERILLSLLAAIPLKGPINSLCSMQLGSPRDPLINIGQINTRTAAEASSFSPNALMKFV